FSGRPSTAVIWRAPVAIKRPVLTPSAGPNSMTVRPLRSSMSSPRAIDARRLREIALVIRQGFRFARKAVGFADIVIENRDHLPHRGDRQRQLPDRLAPQVPLLQSEQRGVIVGPPRYVAEDRAPG